MKILEDSHRRRFRTVEAAQQLMENPYLKPGEIEGEVFPWIEENRISKHNPEYKKAPYEIVLLEKDNDS